MWSEPHDRHAPSDDDRSTWESRVRVLESGNVGKVLTVIGQQHALRNKQRHCPTGGCLPESMLRVVAALLVSLSPGRPSRAG